MTTPIPYYKLTITLEGTDGTHTELIAEKVQYPTITPQYSDSFSLTDRLDPPLDRLIFSFVPYLEDGKLYTLISKEAPQ